MAMATSKAGARVEGMAKGYVLHEGPSPFVGQPIVSIATNEEWICDLLRAMSRKVETGELD